MSVPPGTPSLGAAHTLDFDFMFPLKGGAFLDLRV